MSTALTVAIVTQDAGRTATDTKLDLVVDPARFLRQAWSMWDPLGEGGRMQNQAYGYLFPMGPFFAFARWIDVPPWITQRLWESGLVVCAFLGTYYLARALGVTRMWPAVGAGLAYSMTPRVLAEITSNSAELLPTMVLPWVLLPLVRGAQRGSPRRAAALSAIALLFAGGTNAGATLAILPIPIFWLLTRARSRRRTALLRWCALTLPLATIWWVVPLLLLGRYSPPFVDWIEASGNTTISTSLLASLRGIPQWQAYLGHSYWPAGWIYAATPAMVVATSVIAAAGLAGLAWRGTPNRVFLCSCLGLGLVAVTLGHAASVGPVFDDQGRTLLDGPLVPFRNVHKFQALVTLPLAIGLGFVSDWIRAEAPTSTRRGALLQSPVAQAVLAVSAVSIGAIALGPVLSNHLVSAGRVETMAGYWEGTSRWLAANSGGSRALIVPGAPFPNYFWGETGDDAIQPVAQSPWLVRSAVPLAQPGLIRLLDVIEGRLATGRSDPSLASLLARSGIGFVVVRHDLDSVASEAIPQSLVRSTLEASPGFERATAIGPRIGEPGGRHWLVDGGAGGPRSAIEIYEVGPASAPIGLLSAEGTIRSNGSTDSLASLVDAGLPTATPVLFGSDGLDLDLGGTVTVATDGVRRQQDGFGGRFRRSGTLSASEPFSGERAVFDYLPDGIGTLSTFRYVGIADVAASSSGADVTATVNASPGFGPWSALDGDPKSAWGSAAWHGAVGEWLEIRFTEPVDPGSIDITFAQVFGPFPSRLEVTTDTASLSVPVVANSFAQTVAVPPGETTTLRLTVRAMAGGGAGLSVGIASLDIPGVRPQRTLDVPAVGSPAVIRFAVAPGYRSDCLAVPGGVACDPSWAMAGEEDGALDRSFTLTESRSYEGSATVRLTPGPELDRLLDVGSSMQATATSNDSTDPRRRAGAAVDGDPMTAWVAAPGDGSPMLTLDLGEARPVRAIRIVTEVDAPTARPTLVWIHAGDQDWIGTLPGDGLIRLPSTAVTDTVQITIVEAEIRQSIAMRDRSVRWLPVGINEVRVDPAPPSEVVVPATIEFDCDAGLKVVIDGTPIRLSVAADRSAALSGTSVRAEPCDGATVPLEVGRHRLTLQGTPWAAPMSFALSDANLAEVRGATGRASIEQWNATSRRVRVDVPAQSILIVHENFNRGWTAQIDGRRLKPVRVDGWQQGFIVPAGSAGVVELSFAPQRAVVTGLILGAAGIPLLLGLALVQPRERLMRSVGERPVGVGVGVGLTLITGTLLTGLPGLAAIIAVLATGRLLFGQVTRTPMLGAPVLLIAAGITVATAPSGWLVAEASSPVVQTLSVVAVAIAFVTGLTRDSHDP